MLIMNAINVHSKNSEKKFKLIIDFYQFLIKTKCNSLPDMIFFLQALFNDNKIFLIHHA